MNYFFTCFVFLSFLSIPAAGREIKTRKAITAITRTIPDTMKWEKQVFDDEKNFTASQVDFLDSLIGLHRRKASDEIVIISIAPADIDYIITQAQFDEYANLMFTTLDVGSRNNNRGAGIFFSVKLRKIRIAVSSGLTMKLTDKEAKRIIEEVITPSFKRSDYFTGISNGLQAIFKILE